MKIADSETRTNRQTARRTEKNSDRRMGVWIDKRDTMWNKRNDSLKKVGGEQVKSRKKKWLVCCSWIEWMDGRTLSRQEAHLTWLTEISPDSETDKRQTGAYKQTGKQKDMLAARQSYRQPAYWKTRVQTVIWIACRLTADTTMQTNKQTNRQANRVTETCRCAMLCIHPVGGRTERERELRKQKRVEKLMDGQTVR